jgi:hypothetical protein
MSARIIPLPRRDRGAVFVKREEGDWLAIYDGQAWSHSSREAALQEAIEIADQVNASIIIEPPYGRGEHSPC